MAVTVRRLSGETGMLRRVLGLLLALAMSLVLAACETTQSVVPTETNRAEMAPWTDVLPPYRINPGDKVRVFYQRTPELNEVALVAPDGSIGLRAAGQVVAAGRTLGELEQQIAHAATRMLTDPVVTVALDEAAGALVYVGGAVREPGVYPLTGRVGALEAILRAHGFDAEARMTQVVLIRRAPSNRPMLRTIDVRGFAATASLQDDVPLVAGDILFVPRNRAAEVDLWIDQFINRALPFSRSFGYVIQPAGGHAPF